MTMKQKLAGPGKHYRQGMTIVDVIAKFPDDKTAEAWIAVQRWSTGPECPRCGCANVQHPTAHKTMPYRCSGKGCRRFFSVRTGTVMADSKLGYQKWPSPCTCSTQTSEARAA